MSPFIFPTMKLFDFFTLFYLKYLLLCEYVEAKSLSFCFFYKTTKPIYNCFFAYFSFRLAEQRLWCITVQTNVEVAKFQLALKLLNITFVKQIHSPLKFTEQRNYRKVPKNYRKVPKNYRKDFNQNAVICLKSKINTSSVSRHNINTFGSYTPSPQKKINWLTAFMVEVYSFPSKMCKLYVMSNKEFFTGIFYYCFHISFQARALYVTVLPRVLTAKLACCSATDQWFSEGNGGITVGDKGASRKTNNYRKNKAIFLVILIEII